VKEEMKEEEEGNCSFFFLGWIGVRIGSGIGRWNF